MDRCFGTSTHQAKCSECYGRFVLVSAVDVVRLHKEVGDELENLYWEEF
jgi:hypothetical protein